MKVRVRVNVRLRVPGGPYRLAQSRRIRPGLVPGEGLGGRGRVRARARVRVSVSVTVGFGFRVSLSVRVTCDGDIRRGVGHLGLIGGFDEGFGPCVQDVAHGLELLVG